MESLRERKKERTRQAIADAAISMFLARGFEQVSTADVAASVEVSKPTLFRYFPTKEDLVVHRFADHIGEHARVVRARAGGERPLAALHRHFREGLARREPVTGLCDEPAVLAFHRLVFETPSLASRVADIGLQDVGSLAAAFAEAVPGASAARPRLLAVQVIAVHLALARANWARLADGRPAADVHDEAAAEAADAFALLGDGASGSGF
ncbi:TetR/AcrR family transcriptional regulator [Pseudonocardia sp. TRM90224]|uniref:TetR/AcrR family transcriptional regulator n=1 Tax=Pseudonocardia sp. TRM90224 TaxID=2812678 RepID=UPI001E37ED95|nr:TetR/AcrR family transcriptional regulator [Pseudonocardia sp. TRM90224]